MGTVFLVLFGVAVIIKGVDWARQLSGAQISKAVTQVVAWSAGIVMTFLVTALPVVQQFAVNGFRMEDLDGLTKALAGLAAGSVASLVKDLLSALAKTLSDPPPLLAGRDRV